MHTHPLGCRLFCARSKTYDQFGINDDSPHTARFGGEREHHSLGLTARTAPPRVEAHTLSLLCTMYYPRITDCVCQGLKALCKTHYTAKYGTFSSKAEFNFKTCKRTEYLFIAIYDKTNYLLYIQTHTHTQQVFKLQDESRHHSLFPYARVRERERGGSLIWQPESGVES